MERDYSHITRMENIMVRQERTIRELESVLEKLDHQQADYEALSTYYFSDTRERDLEDEEKHRIPEDLARGVLSEDEVWNLFQDTREAALHMAETALKILKTNG